MFLSTLSLCFKNFKLFSHKTLFSKLLNNRLASTNFSSIVPEGTPILKEHVDLLTQFFKKNSKQGIAVLTGAGISTESGIPDYRSPNGAYSKGHQPIKYSEFIKSEKNRKRYWARSMIGWLLLSNAKPNLGHNALAILEKYNLIHSLLTQNVDRLHLAAGSRNIIELHGTIHSVICLSCQKETPREIFQQQLRNLNSSFWEGFGSSAHPSSRPDGDVDIESSLIAEFIVPPCDHCGGILKPNVVFFGENVPTVRVNNAIEQIEKSKALLVIGSSLQVFSAYRFVRLASERKMDIGIINIGETRGDELSSFKLETQSGILLHQLISQLGLTENSEMLTFVKQNNLNQLQFQN